MVYKPIALAVIGSLVGACTLQAPGSPGSYSALDPRLAGVGRADLPDGFTRTPADGSPPTRPDRRKPAGGTTAVEPVAALGASEHARSRWESLRPDELTRAPVATAHPPPNVSTLSAAPAATTNARGPQYDRDAAMQTLIGDGRAAGRRICDGC